MASTGMEMDQLGLSSSNGSSTVSLEQSVVALENLHRQILPFILRRMKEDVLQDLPPKIIQDYTCEMCPLQVELYDDFSKNEEKELLSLAVVDNSSASSNNSGSGTFVAAGSRGVDNGELVASEGRRPSKSAFELLQYARKLCDHPSLILTEEHPRYLDIMKRLRQEGKNLNDIEFSPKLLALKELIIDSMEGKHRMLVFCQLHAMLNIVETYVLKPPEHNVTYLRLDSSVTNVQKRQEIVQKFNQDPTINVLLLTARVGGLGLNLTGADTVIFVEHDYNPMVDLQAMDRTHRLGQTKCVNVYRLIMKDTIEEKIMGLQRFKLFISKNIVNRENTSFSTMDTSQLLSSNAISKAVSSTTVGTGLAVTAGQASNGTPTKQDAESAAYDQLLGEEGRYKEYDIQNVLEYLPNNNTNNGDK